ncbi:hypothetical protein C7974DRAFT_443147 [Boeremia exigua]|uniref:uncharacterized protein n=1 Tax=Boeremia exigua TaxID=749465 RepID=UPI001E8DA434|nr:uncharacterized protein C7974DRAFT_443147 [Boeremia exigua]KAH6615055.1 hypothetical protein C7974DRAFT_443147 [Boeremia exigua]
MKYSTKHDHEDPSHGLRPTPVISPSQATIEAVEKINQNRLPHIPCQSHVGLEEEAKATCPASIKQIWGWTEHTPEDAAHEAELAGLKPTQLSTTPRTINRGAVTTSGTVFEVPVRGLRSPPLSPRGKMYESFTPPTPPPPLMPPTPPPPRFQAIQTTSQSGDRAERRRMIGRVLVSVRDRVPAEDWLEGIKELEGRGGNVEKFYNNLSEGGVRDV